MTMMEMMINMVLMLVCCDWEVEVMMMMMMMMAGTRQSLIVRFKRRLKADRKGAEARLIEYHTLLQCGSFNLIAIFSRHLS